MAYGRLANNLIDDLPLLFVYIRMASSSIVCSARFGPLLQMENVLSSGDISKTKSAQEVVLKLLETKTKI